MPKLIECVSCGHWIAKNAKSCPSCGATNWRSAHNTNRIIGPLLGVLLLIIVGVRLLNGDGLFGFGTSSTKRPSPAPTTSSAGTSSPSPTESEDTVILEKDGIIIKYTGINLTQYLSGQPNAVMLTVGLNVQNDSESDITVYPIDSSVNDVMKQAISGLPFTVLAGKKSVSGFSFANLDGTDIETTKDIDKVEKIEFKLTIRDNDFNEILKSDVITIEP